MEGRETDQKNKKFFFIVGGGGGGYSSSLSLWGLRERDGQTPALTATSTDSLSLKVCIFNDIKVRITPVQSLELTIDGQPIGLFQTSAQYDSPVRPVQVNSLDLRTHTQVRPEEDSKVQGTILIVHACPLTVLTQAYT